MAQEHKLKAETLKLELEAQEIDRRLNAPWWRGQKLAQYTLAIIITSAVLFGWTRIYLEPILRQETELNKVSNATLDARNEELSIGNKKLSKDQEVLKTANATLDDRNDELSRGNSKLNKDQKILKTANAKLEKEKIELMSESETLTKQKQVLEREKKKLTIEGEELEKQKLALESVVAGLNQAVEIAARGDKFFSLMNRDDPIKELSSSYGWNMWSDNYFGSQMGYYLVINHQDVRSDKNIFVCRIIEINELERRKPNDWRKSLKLVTDKSPVLALDYSYFGLLDDTSVPVGGTIYKQNGETVKFYAPLSEWSKQLGELFQAE